MNFISTNKTHFFQWQSYLLRVAIIFFLLQSLPVNAEIYKTIANISWSTFISDVFNIVIYLPHVFGPVSGFADWFLVLGISLILAYVWYSKSIISDEKETKYFYFLRVAVRFRLASILFVAGFTKLFTLFAPELSLSHLNTGYGYFENWKQLYLSLSAAPAYAIFLGIVELFAAFLLLFRKTSLLGVLFIIPFYGNVFLADLAYEGSYFMVSAYAVLLTIPIFVYDIKKLGNLLIDLKLTSPVNWHFNWNSTALGKWRPVLKGAFVLFFVVLVGFKSYSLSQGESLYYPSEKGLEEVAGKYNVDLFILNSDTLEYSPFDKQRWKDVVFEEWNTLSVRINDSIKTADPHSFLEGKSSDRDYEYTQVGDRLYYHYQIQNGNKEISLQNPNPNYPNDQFTFYVERPDSLHINLKGENSKGDKYTVALSKVDKKYLLYEIKNLGRRKLGYKL